MQLTLTDGFHQNADERGHREALLHAFRGVDDSVPERPEHQRKDDELHNRNGNEPVNEHKRAHDDLHHLRVESLLAGDCCILVNCVTFLTRVDRFHEDSVAVEEPDGEENDLHQRDQQRVVEVETVGQATEHWDA